MKHAVSANPENCAEPEPSKKRNEIEALNKAQDDVPYSTDLWESLAQTPKLKDKAQITSTSDSLQTDSANKSFSSRKKRFLTVYSRLPSFKRSSTPRT